MTSASGDPSVTPTEVELFYHGKDSKYQWLKENRHISPSVKGMWLKVMWRLRRLRVIWRSHDLIRSPSSTLSALLSSEHSLQPQGHITVRKPAITQAMKYETSKKSQGTFLQLTGQTESHSHMSFQRGPGNVVLILCGHVSE